MGPRISLLPPGILFVLPEKAAFNPAHNSLAWVSLVAEMVVKNPSVMWETQV